VLRGATSLRLACVICGADHLTVPTPRVPVGPSATGPPAKSRTVPDQILASGTTIERKAAAETPIAEVRPTPDGVIPVFRIPTPDVTVPPPGTAGGIRDGSAVRTMVRSVGRTYHHANRPAVLSKPSRKPRPVRAARRVQSELEVKRQGRRSGHGHVGAPTCDGRSGPRKLRPGCCYVAI
jgi:hypothetical protein